MSLFPARAAAAPYDENGNGVVAHTADSFKKRTSGKNGNGAAAHTAGPPTKGTNISFPSNKTWMVANFRKLPHGKLRTADPSTRGTNISFPLKKTWMVASCRKLPHGTLRTAGPSTNGKIFRSLGKNISLPSKKIGWLQIFENCPMANCGRVRQTGGNQLSDQAAAQGLSELRPDSNIWTYEK